jgi:hypothetical protein
MHIFSYIEIKKTLFTVFYFKRNMATSPQINSPILGSGNRTFSVSSKKITNFTHGPRKMLWEAWGFSATVNFGL